MATINSIMLNNNIININDDPVVVTAIFKFVPRAKLAERANAPKNPPINFINCTKISNITSIIINQTKLLFFLSLFIVIKNLNIDSITLS